MMIRQRQPGFEKVENLVQYTWKAIDFSMISGYFGQQWNWTAFHWIIESY